MPISVRSGTDLPSFACIIVFITSIGLPTALPIEPESAPARNLRPTEAPFSPAPMASRMGAYPPILIDAYIASRAHAGWIPFQSDATPSVRTCPAIE